MTDQDATTPANAPTDQRDPEAIREEINRTREDMGETLDALSAKLDVKGQTKAKAEEAKSQAKAKAGQAKAQAETLVSQAKGQTQTLASQAKDQAQAIYRRQPAAVIAGAGAILAIVAGLLVRRARR
jgi:ElaB/YqjD/DUF883 family membrane-anchored ribosome-binding protein